MKRKLLFLFILSSLSCTKKQSETTFFGGEIVNPRNTAVYLFYKDKVIDSAVVDKNGRFMFELANPVDGLYHFEHIPEYQWLILEKGDSIMVRLNTMDFDESMIFSGKGAEKNNFILDMFLFKEDEEKLTRQYIGLEPSEFQRKIDSLRDMKWEQYESLQKEESLSETALHIARASILYPTYRLKELYPLDYKFRKAKYQLPELPESYYEYRKEVNYNDSLLAHYIPYFNFLVNHLNNLSYEQCKQACGPEGKKFSSLHFGLHKMELIDSLVQVNDLRDHLLKNAALSYFLIDHDHNNNERLLNDFLALSGNEEDKMYITSLHNNIRKLQPGEAFPDLKLISILGEEVTLNADWFNSTTVLYFWSLNQPQQTANMKRRIQSLQKEYPDVTFVGINVDKNHDRWINSLQIPRTEHIQTQFRTPDFEKTRLDLVIYAPNRILVINKEGRIVEGFGNIYNRIALKGN